MNSTFKPLPTFVIHIMLIITACLFALFVWLAYQSYSEGMHFATGTAIGKAMASLMCMSSLLSVAFVDNTINPPDVTTVDLSESNKPVKRFEQSIVAQHYKKLGKGQYVYVLQDVDVTGYCKIGFTNSPRRRLNRFGVKLPMNTLPVHVIACDDMRQMERDLHTLFAHKRVNGEWFDLEQGDIDLLNRLGNYALAIEWIASDDN